MAGPSTAGITSPSYGSAIVNGQLVGAQTVAAYTPLNYGGGITAVPAASPMTIPPSVGYGYPNSAANFSVPNASVPANAGTNQQRPQYIGKMIESPGVWGLILLIIGFTWMRYVHWKR